MFEKKKTESTPLTGTHLFNGFFPAKKPYKQLLNINYFIVYLNIFDNLVIHDYICLICFRISIKLIRTQYTCIPGNYVKCTRIFKESYYAVGAAAVRAASRLAEESRGTPVKSTDNKPEKKAATPSEKPSTVSH